MEILKSDISIDFIGKKRGAIFLSFFIIIIGIILFFVKDGLQLGIDFSGGTLIQIQFTEKVYIDKIRASFHQLGMGSSSIQQFGSDRDILINAERFSEVLEDMNVTVKNQLEKDFAPESFEVVRVEMVGPKVGRDLREQAILSIFYALIGIIIYISWRFEFRFAVAAIIALIHDILVTTAFFLLFDKEFSLPIIAAFLTIIGYSLNDTIVVFDRIRENLRKIRKKNFEHVINFSINQTLSRTILTSLTTLIVVLALFFLGGEVIHDFSFALMIGVFVGTYSSIFIASPVLLVWEKQKQRKR
jgi:preprotein translocase subunit SecF